MTTETILWLLVILVGILSFTLIFGLVGLNRKIEQRQDLNPLHTKVDLIFKQNQDVIEKFTEKKWRPKSISIQCDGNPQSEDNGRLHPVFG